MSRLFRSFAILLVSALALAGCLPMAMFASGSGPGYSGLKQDWGTYVSSSNVNALCISPKLRFVIWEGCYPGRSFIHVDVRDRPRGYRRPVTFSGC
jgi:hypothetical protein